MTTITRRAPRYRITVIEHDRVELTTSDPAVRDLIALRDSDADTLRLVYAAYGSAGYVHEISDPRRPGTLGPQVCEQLASRGSTLMCSPKTGIALAALIRRELRRAMAADEARRRDR